MLGKKEQKFMPTMRCFDIGGTKIVCADVSECGTITELARVPTPTHSYDAFVGELSKLCADNSKIEAIGISIAGTINADTQVISSANIACVSGKPLASELSEALSHKVHVINDANAFGLAQARLGKAKNHEVVLALILGTGVGGSIIIDGSIVNGRHGTAGEWGHGPATAARTGFALPTIRCECGQPNCLDVIGSARGIELLYKQLTSNELTCPQVIALWQSGDEQASEVADVWLDVVGGALANIVNFLEPSIVAVGGGLANAVPLITALDAEVSLRRMEANQTGLLYCATSGPEQGLLGAALYCQTQ